VPGGENKVGSEAEGAMTHDLGTPLAAKPLQTMSSTESWLSASRRYRPCSLVVSAPGGTSLSA
jgi:hypothetical protein